MVHITSSGIYGASHLITDSIVNSDGISVRTRDTSEVTTPGLNGRGISKNTMSKMLRPWFNR